MSSAIGLYSLKEITSHAAKLLMTNDEEASSGSDQEAKCVTAAVLHFFAPQLVVVATEEDEEELEIPSKCAHVEVVGWSKLRELLETYFPASTDGEEEEETGAADGDIVVLIEAVKTELQERHLQCNAALLQNVRVSK